MVTVHSERWSPTIGFGMRSRSSRICEQRYALRISSASSSRHAERGSELVPISFSSSSYFVVMDFHDDAHLLQRGADGRTEYSAANQQEGQGNTLP